MDIKEVRLEIEESGFEAPHVFASLLDGEELFTQHSEILGAVYIKREYFSGPKEKANIESTAKLLIATSRGVVYVEEGIEKICEDDCGYKMKFIPYNKITCLEVDFCWLLGIFKICSGS